MENKNSPTRSVERALEILECFLDNDQLTLLEISEKTNLPQSTVHRLILALKSKHFIERDVDTKKYFLGSKLNQLSNKFSGNNEYLKKIAYNHLLRLNEKYNENVRLFVQEGEYKLCIEAVESTRSLRQVIKVGDKHLLLKGAAGRVLLAYMDEDKMKEILKDDDSVYESFAKVRENGYALSIGEREEGLVGIAAPIKNEEGKVVAALSLSGPSIRFINDEMTDKIKDTIKIANDISNSLGYIEKK